MTLHPEDHILFFGDSITDNDRNRQLSEDLGGGYPLYVASYLEHRYPDFDLRFSNRGIGGNRINDLLERLTTDCLALKPDVVSILIGVNDTWHTLGEPGFGGETIGPSFEEQYRKLLTDITASGITRIVLIEPFLLPYPVDRYEWRSDLDQRLQVVRKMAVEFNCLFVPLDGRLNQLGITHSFQHYTGEDGVHPTRAGHVEIAKAWLEAVDN